VAINGIPAVVKSSSPNQVVFFVPQGLPAGPATLTISNGAAAALPVAVEIAGAPATIVAATTTSGAPVDATRAAGVGDTIYLAVAGLDTNIAGSPARVQVTVAGVPMTVQQIVAAPQGLFQVQFTLSQSFGAATVPVLVAQDGSAGAPYLIATK
jgi:uncharacterized protein (TIGR03437 family)